MQKTILKLINFFFKIQEKFLEKKYNTKNSMYKTQLTSSATLTLSGALEETKNQIKNEIKSLAKNGLDELIKYAKENGACFYYSKNAKKILKPIDETTGIIFPKKGIKAFYLNLFFAKKISFKTNTIFIFENEKLSPYDILYNFYKWYAYNSKLPGFEDENLSEIKNLDKLENNIEKLNYKDIMGLKQAIARDREAMQFTLDFIKENEGFKNAYNKLKDNGANL